MKRKQLSFTEAELAIILDALHNQWWVRYDPKVETTVADHHKLMQRIVDASVALTTDEDQA